MKKYLYLEGTNGISGDMLVAALLDLGASREKLDAALASLRREVPHEFDISISRKSSYSISGCDFDVRLHHHEPHHEESYNALHHHEHRHLADVERIINHVAMDDTARKLAKRIFRIVAEAEAKAHGCPIDQVHFHEVGATDSLADIIAIAVLAKDLDPDGWVMTGLAEGSGTVMCQHGELPVPVPAVLNIAAAYDIPLRPSPTIGEMVTPTGIAAAAALRTHDKLPPSYRIISAGIGLGKRDFGRANFLRALLIKPTEEAATEMEDICELAANIDDSTPEDLSYLQELLLELGARDVWFCPCTMKKSRPAVLLGALVDAALVETAEDCILRHSSTIGVRRHTVQRTVMQREFASVQLLYGTVRVKRVQRGDIVRFYPEYESMKELARSTGLPLRKIREDIAAALPSEV